MKMRYTGRNEPFIISKGPQKMRVMTGDVVDIDAAVASKLLVDYPSMWFEESDDKGMKAGKKEAMAREARKKAADAQKAKIGTAPAKVK